MSYRNILKIVLSACALLLILSSQNIQAQQVKAKKDQAAPKISSAPIPLPTPSPDQQTLDQEAPFVDPLRGTYPDPKKVGVPQPVYRATPGAQGSRDRYAKIPEAEVIRRHWEEQCRDECCQDNPCPPQEKCPLCVDDPKTPCGNCKMCQAGFPCEKTLCRHCIQQRSQNMCNSCDLTAGDEPCGTCDACREHRSDPCEHADDGHGIRGEFNPYKERRLFSVIPRPILDAYNNNARKFPVYYNPAPYYRPHWNPSLYAGYARPFSFRWSCPLCYKDPCQCDKPGFAGQVSYAYSCKFCNRNPCACAEDICNVTKELNPKGVGSAMKEERRTSTRIQDAEERQSAPTPLTSAPLSDTDQGPSDSILDDDSLPSLRDAPNPSRDRMQQLLRQESDPGLPQPPPTLDGPKTSRRAGGFTILE